LIADIRRGPRGGLLIGTPHDRRSSHSTSRRSRRPLHPGALLRSVGICADGKGLRLWGYRRPVF
jgi:hypothetical protein